MGEQDSDSLRKKSLVKWRNLKMEDLSRQLDAKQLQIENDRHDNLTCQRQTTRMWREVLQWRPKTAEERNREEGDKKRLEETKETLRERDEENNVERDEKQDTGGINRHPETETEQGDVGSDLDKPPGLRNGVSNNGEKAEKEERESETGEAEFPRTQGRREMMDQSAADTAAVLGPIADEAGGPTGQDKEEKQSTEDGASGHEAEAAGHEAEAAGLSSPREEPHMAGEGGESVELRKGKKTRRGCRGRRNKKKKTDETVSSEDERKEEEEEEEEDEGSGQDSGIQHRRRVEERSREEVAMGTDMMRLSFWCPRGGERGEKWSYQRGRLQLVKRSAQKQHRPNWVGETRVAPC
ncbi:hypothetical protein AALO_G00073520 [Alosa alosa]|uniref:Uncharacterized protein n=1 Tax=Alosa alosa TaxID=278164 RepID=A0AAV6H3D7_9TELE|nr:hypothetical protein AALO_G00073520 [Alosa alosa]